MAHPAEALPTDEARGIVINWQNVLKRIVSDYEEHTEISHGVQKDAVQNAWDARVDKNRARDWAVAFELLDNGNGYRVLTITDWGTTGLTGRILEPHELLEDLPTEERWGRFENMAFTKDPDEEALGARGQGKFIFVAASKEQHIAYDTLRRDGVYRLGTLRIDGPQGNTWAWEGEEAEAWLEKLAPSLEPLDHVGTRVIVIDPIDELADAVCNGRLADMISETWWEIILKYNATIAVRYDGNEWVASVPDLMRLPDTKPQAVQVWSKENQKIVASGESYRIKRFVAVHLPNEEVPTSLRGIALQRGGMKVASETYQYGAREAEAHIYGYIQFDKKLDLEMAKAESSTHYGFTWRKAVPQAVRRFINSEMATFYRELGYGPDPEAVKHRKRSEAESRALKAANKVAKALGIVGGGVGASGTRNRAGGGDNTPLKLVAVTIPELELPTETLRVDYGDEVKGIAATIHNRTEYDVDALLKLYVTLGDQVVVELYEEELTVTANNTFSVGPFSLDMNRTAFPTPGKYTVRAKLVSLMSEPTPGMGRKGKEVDKAAKIFYLAVEPPVGGLFEEVNAVEWNDTERQIVLGDYYPGERKGYIYQYNVAHKSYEVLGNDELAVAEHVFRLLVQAIMEIDLEAEKPVLFEAEDLDKPEAVARRMGRVLGEALHEYYE